MEGLADLASGGLPSFRLTALFAGVFAMMAVALAVLVVRARIRNKVSLGDAGSEDMLKAIRAHGNFTEYVPLFLICMAMMEWFRTPEWILITLGVIMVVARVLHALAIHKDIVPFRVTGTFGTWGVLLLAGLQSVFRGLGLY